MSSPTVSALTGATLTRPVWLWKSTSTAINYYQHYTIITLVIKNENLNMLSISKNSLWLNQKKGDDLDQSTRDLWKRMKQRINSRIKEECDELVVAGEEDDRVCDADEILEGDIANRFKRLYRHVCEGGDKAAATTTRRTVPKCDGKEETGKMIDLAARVSGVPCIASRVYK